MLNGSKRLIPLKELRTVAIANFPEVSVKTLWDEYKDRKEVKDYFPPKLCKGRTLDRTYFFNVLNTFLGEELKAILDHAHTQRTSISDVR